MKKKSFSFTFKMALAAGVLLLCSSLNARAAYEISSVVPTDSSVVIGSTPFRYTQDLSVTWDDPSFGTDVKVGYVYVWNRSNALLSFAELNKDDSSTYATNGAFIDQSTPDLATLASSNFLNDDSTDLWYLHLKTVYLDNANGGLPTHSSDKVFGPFNIDNVVNGTFCLPNPDCSNPLASTRNTQLTIQLNPPNDLDVNGVFIADSASTDPVPARPTTGVAGDTASYSLSDTTPGDKTIYVWFEDGAGNISPAPETASFTLLSAVSINPNSATIDLSGNNTQVFTISGTSDTQNWTISSQTPDTPGDTVCSLTGDTGTTSVTLTGLNSGTCVLQATSTVDSSVVTTGTIYVTESSSTITQTYSAGLNLVPFTFVGTGITNASDLDSAIVAANQGVTVSQIFGWDATNQRFTTAYVNLGGGFVLDDFALTPGEAYFVEVSGPATLNISGADYTSLPLKTGLNLMSVPLANLSTVTTSAELDAEIVGKTGTTVSQIFGWDATNQRFSTAYVNLGGGFTLDDFTLSIQAQGYFIEVSSDVTYNP